MACQENYVVDIVEGQHQKCWIPSIQEQVKKYNREEVDKKLRKTSIFCLPTFAKKMKEKAFTPQVASFGPIHHGNSNLKQMEDYKRHVLVHFLNKARIPLQRFVDAIEAEVEELQGSYQGLEEHWMMDLDKFIKLMIMDGCFMLELLRVDQKNGDKSYPDHDPIFSEHGVHNKLPYIKRDMLMLENQLPLKVLKVLIDVETGQTGAIKTENYINQLVHKFYWPNEECKTEKLGLHVLDVYRKNMIKATDTIRSPSRPGNNPKHEQEVVFTATKLRECGVRFKMSTSNKIKFNNGVLELPSILIDDSAECTYLNLMAFEHLHVGQGNEITSYICFMDELIDSALDVHLLVTKGIIVNAVGSEKAVAEILNSLTKEVISDPSGGFKVIREDLKAHSRWKINKWKASLKHTHFSNPWSVTALFAATLLLVLTIVQTVYSGLGYYHGR